MSEPHSPETHITGTPGTPQAPADAHGHHAAAAPFSAGELGELRSSDILAGKLVVCLMAGIFSVGLVLYSIILIAVST
jgi:hypothetical protein